MNRLHVQEMLRAGCGLDALTAPPYSLVMKRHQTLPNLVLFKYNQIESDMNDPLVVQCRGLILDEADNWACVSRPFDKFWNLHEGRAATINWRHARVQEKLDGSLMQVYHYRGGWHVGTSGTPDASGDVNGTGETFKALFWRTWTTLGYTLPVWAMENFTFLFELMTPANRVVVRHAEPRIVLIGVRDRTTGQEFGVRRPWNKTWTNVKEFGLGSIENVMSTFDTMQPLDQEGYVIVDAAFNRVKVKHPGYVALHHLRDNLTPKGIVEVVRRGEVDEVLASFPEWRPEFEKIGNLFLRLVGQIETVWGRERDIVVQKQFALLVKDLPYSGVLFALRKGTFATVREALLDTRIETLTSWLKEAE